jgi:DNA polymerase III subunit gamma/tau
VTYISLYRRRRPLCFTDMAGQEHITRTLCNALSSGHMAHAYLFCGPRGTGKTTAAKILARAMNCEQYPVAEPCGKCTPCQNIHAGVSIDVIEMDAASNRGIDEIRELRERSRFASGESRYKIYIIDEAHMLTPEACNAFLKTLEEPPRNVVFILATTDPSRLPSTIVSRCQRFDFHLLTIEQIEQRIIMILDEEGWQAEPEAVNLIARLADGSLRDALGILEQCASYQADLITADHVRIVTGVTRADIIADLVQAAIKNDLDRGFKVIEQVIYTGRDLRLFWRDLTYIFTRLLLSSNDAEEKISISYPGFADIIVSCRGKVGRDRLLDAVELLHEVEGELRNAHFPQYILEVAYIRLLRLLHGRIQPVMSKVLPEDESRAAKAIEHQADSSDISTPVPNEIQVVKEPSAEVQDSKGVEALTGRALVDQLTSVWADLIEDIKSRQKSTAAWLEPARIVDCSGNLVRLGYEKDYAIHQIRIMEDSHRKLVEKVLSSYCQRDMDIKADIFEPASKATEITKSNDHRGSSSKEKTEKKETPSSEDALKMFGGKIIE